MKDYPRAGGNAKGPLFRCPEHNEFFGPDQKPEYAINEDGTQGEMIRPGADRCSGCEPA